MIISLQKEALVLTGDGSVRYKLKTVLNNSLVSTAFILPIIKFCSCHQIL